MRCILSGAALLVSAGLAMAATQEVPLIAAWAPIDTVAIHLPAKSAVTADEALARGQVTNARFPMAGKASKPWRVAFLFPHLKDPYWVGCNYGVLTEAKRLGIAADIFVADGYNDLIGQLQHMDQAIAGHYDAIVLSPISMVANNPSIARARAQGIAVFELANDSTSPDLQLKVTTSMQGMGETTMQWVIRDARRRGLKEINVALLPGPADAGWVKGEVDGTRKVANHSPIKVNIVDIRYGDSDRIIQTQLAAQTVAMYGQKLDYLLGCSGCAPAARLPIRDAGLDKKIRIVAYDLTREIAELIRTHAIAAATDTRSISQARVVTSSVVNYLEGKAKAPGVILIRLGLLDTGNFAQYPLQASIPPAEFEPILAYRPLPVAGQ